MELSSFQIDTLVGILVDKCDALETVNAYLIKENENLRKQIKDGESNVNG